MLFNSKYSYVINQVQKNWSAFLLSDIEIPKRNPDFLNLKSNINNYLHTGKRIQEWTK